MKRLRDMELRERPREKLQYDGAGKLSDVELLMILLGTGTKGFDVRAVANEIVKIVDRKGLALQVEDIKTVKGIGPAKATNIAAAFEFVRRRVRERGLKITRPGEVYPLIRHYGDRMQEHFLVVTLNGANEVMQVRVVTVGLLNRTQVHPREVFADAISERAASLILAHNHPSGNLTPSSEDLTITKRLREVGDMVGIRVLDHLIFSARGYISMADRNEL